MTADVGEPDLPGPDRGKRGAMRREPLTRNTGEDFRLTNLSTKRQRIAELARTNRGVALSSLHHVIDLEWLKESYQLTRKDGCSWHRRRDGERVCGKPGGQSPGPPGSHQVGSLQSAAGPQDICSKNGRLAQTARHPDAGCIMHLVQFGLGDGMAMREEFATQSRSLRSVASVMVMTYGRPGFLFCAVMRPPSIQ